MSWRDFAATVVAGLCSFLILACGSDDDSDSTATATAAAQSSTTVAATASATVSGGTGATGGAATTADESRFIERARAFLTNPVLAAALRTARQSRNDASWCAQLRDEAQIRAVRASQMQTGPDVGQDAPARFRNADQALWDAMQAAARQCPGGVAAFNQASYNQAVDDLAKAWSDLAVLVGLPSPGF